MKKLLIIGGGASGIVAGIYAKKRGLDVTILEKNNEVLKKLLLTGNGKCNYFNEYFDETKINSENKELAKMIFSEDNINEAKVFFENIGIVPKVKNGYCYPFANNSYCMKESLINEAKNCGVKIKTNIFVNTIERKSNKFIVNNDYECDYLVLSTGSKSALKDADMFNGYKLLKSFGHKIIKPLPSLVQLKGSETYFDKWAKIRCDVSVKWFEDGKLKKEEKGEIQLTDYGVSGICILNLSSGIIRGLANNNHEEIKIDFLPFTSDHFAFIEKRKKLMPNSTIMEFLESLINYKVMKIILKKSEINEEKIVSSLSETELKRLINNLQAFCLNITGYKSFLDSQVTSGGLDLNEVYIDRLESKRIPNLFITGELLDIDGVCGGYNLMNAWITGIIVGKSVGKND